jgi:hypothetical protein
MNAKVFWSTLAAILVAFVKAKGIPLSVLEEQACQRARLEVTLSVLPSLAATAPVDAEWLQVRVVALREYMASIQANIDWCKRYAKGAEADEQKGFADSLKEYEADLAWAQKAMKEIEKIEKKP